MPIQTVSRLPDSFTEYEGDGIMSNYDGLIDENTASEIKGRELFSRYAGWNFNGKVWWGNNQWNCEVWQYHSHMETVSKDTLEEIMQTVCDKYGYE